MPLSFDHLPDEDAKQTSSGGGLSFDHLPQEDAEPSNDPHARARQWLDAHPEYRGDLTDRALHGLTAGVGDNVMAGIRAARDTIKHGGSLGDNYALEQAMFDERYKNAKATTGLTGDAVDLIGSVVPSSAAFKGVGLSAQALTKAAPYAANYLTPAVQAALGGGLYGGVEAAGDGENIGVGVATGAAGGLLGDIAGKVAGSVASRLLDKAPAIPTTAELYKKGSNLYDEFANSGGMITRQGAEDLFARVNNKLSSPDINYKPGQPSIDDLNNKLAFYARPTNEAVARDAAAVAEAEKKSTINNSLATLDRLRSPVDANAPIGGHMPLQPALTPREVQNIRQLTNGPMRSNDGNQRYIGRAVRNEIDDFLKNLTPEQTAGDFNIGLLNDANRLWTQAKKSERIDRLMQKAADVASVNGTANEKNYRKIALSLKDKAKNLTPDEKAAAQAAIDGTAGQNAARWAGKNLGFHSLPSLAAHIGLHGATGGLFTPINVGVGLASEAAGHMSARAARNGIEELSRLIRAGGNKSSLAPTPSPLANRIKNARPAFGILGGTGAGIRGLLSE